MSQTTPTGEVNPHYRWLRKQQESLKGSLNKVVKYMECLAEPVPSLSAVGHGRAAHDAPEASLCWNQPNHEPREKTGANRGANKLGHVVRQTPRCPEVGCELALGRELLSGRDRQFPQPGGAITSISHLPQNKWGGAAAGAQRALPPCFN